MIAIRRGWVGDLWYTRPSIESTEWTTDGTYVDDQQKQLLVGVYQHAKAACDLREKCRKWYKAHPESDAAGYLYPQEVIDDLRKIEDEQFAAEQELERVLEETNLRQLIQQCRERIQANKQATLARQAAEDKARQEGRLTRSTFKLYVG